MVRDTSTTSYRKITEEGLLSKMRLKVYSFLYTHGPCSANELFREMGGKTRNASNITTRLGELRDIGVASEKGRRVCSVTGMTVIEWDVTSRLPSDFVKTKTKKQKIEEALVLVEKTRMAFNSKTLTKFYLLEFFNEMETRLKDL